MVETDSIATVVLLDDAGRPLRCGDGATSWQLPAGRGVIEGVSAGVWSVRVATPDGQQWIGEVSTPGTGESAIELH